LLQRWPRLRGKRLLVSPKISAKKKMRYASLDSDLSSVFVASLPLLVSSVMRQAEVVVNG
jgi:hypothetical protein